jgi:hypothetical protein
LVTASARCQKGLSSWRPPRIGLYDQVFELRGRKKYGLKIVETEPSTEMIEDMNRSIDTIEEELRRFLSSLFSDDKSS